MVAAVPEGKVVVMMARKHTEPALLAVIEALVERLKGVCVVLESGAAGHQRIGDALRALYGIERLRAGAGRAAAVQGGEIAPGLLVRRPRLLLLGAEPQACVQRGDACVQESGPVFSGERPAPAFRS